MLASTFITAGYSTLTAPERVAGAAEPVAVPLARRVPGLTENPHHLVRINGAVQVAAGTLLAIGWLPRLSALALAGTLVPTTLAGHPYWTVEDPDERARQRIHFYKNLSMMGGLLLAAADTHGKPSLAYRARGRAHAAESAVTDAVTGAVSGATEAVAGALGGVTDAVSGVAGTAASAAGAVADTVTDAAHAARKHLPV